MRRTLISIVAAINFAHASAAEQPDFEVFHRFEQAHIAHHLSEQVCAYMYGDSLPTKEERNRARNLCAAAQYPLYWLSLQQPEWLKQHKPEILRSLDEYRADRAHNRFEEHHREWCKTHPQECFTVAGPLLCETNPSFCDPKLKPFGENLLDQFKEH